MAKELTVEALAAVIHKGGGIDAAKKLVAEASAALETKKAELEAKLEEVEKDLSPFATLLAKAYRKAGEEADIHAEVVTGKKSGAGPKLTPEQKAEKKALKAEKKAEQKKKVSDALPHGETKAVKSAVIAEKTGVEIAVVRAVLNELKKNGKAKTAGNGPINTVWYQ